MTNELTDDIFMSFQCH